MVRTNNPAEAITGWGFVQDNNAPPTGFTKINQDLNAGAGGKYNYLCYIRGGKSKMTQVTF